jgi:hypothetical protein
MPIKALYGDRLDIASAADTQVVANPARKAASVPIQPDLFCRNGKRPDVALINRLDEAANQSVLYRGKEHFAAVGAFAPNLVPFGAGDRTRWRFAFHTGPYAHALYVLVGMTPPGTSGASSNAYCRLDIYSDAAMATLVKSETFVHGVNPTGTAAGSYGWEYLKPLEKFVTGLSPDTDYYGKFTDVDYGQIEHACVCDLQSMTENYSGYLPQNITTHSAVLDKYRQNLATIFHQEWKRGGSRVLWWGVDDGTAPLVRSSATDVNVVDGTSTAVSASTPGYTLDMRGKARVSQISGVPVVMKAFGNCAFGSGIVKLKNSAGSTVATVSVNAASNAWFSTSFNLPATVDKYDLHYAGTGVGSLTLYNVIVYEHE